MKWNGGKQNRGRYAEGGPVSVNQSRKVFCLLGETKHGVALSHPSLFPCAELLFSSSSPSYLVDTFWCQNETWFLTYPSFAEECGICKRSVPQAAILPPQMTIDDANSGRTHKALSDYKHNETMTYYCWLNTTMDSVFRVLLMFYFLVLFTFYKLSLGSSTVLFVLYLFLHCLEIFFLFACPLWSEHTYVFFCWFALFCLCVRVTILGNINGILSNVHVCLIKIFQASLHLSAATNQLQLCLQLPPILSCRF